MKLKPLDQILVILSLCCVIVMICTGLVNWATIYFLGIFGLLYLYEEWE